MVVSYRSGEVAAKEVVSTIEELGGSAEVVQVDVTDEKQVVDAVRRIRTDHGRLDVLVTSAGATDDRHFVAMSSRRFTDLMDVNVTGTFLACREAMRVMQHQRRGAIVTVSSSSGLDGGFPGQANYVASKGAIISFTEAIAYEAARHGVRANVVAPGFVSTDMTQRLPAHMRAQYEQRIRMGRMGRPEEIPLCQPCVRHRDCPDQCRGGRRGDPQDEHDDDIGHHRQAGWVCGRPRPAGPPAGAAAEVRREVQAGGARRVRSSRPRR